MLVESLPTKVGKDDTPLNSNARVVKYPLVILDAGHGGLNDRGEYVTAPNKMFAHDGFTFYEGVFNRKVVKKVCELLEKLEIPFAVVSDEQEDTPLRDRIQRVNALCLKNKALLFSIHANAANLNSPNFSNAKGFMIFTSPGDTDSDKIADKLFVNLKKHLPSRQARMDKSDGDTDYEANFAMLVRTACPAVLVESGFFTNKEEAAYLMTDDAQLRIATAIVETITSL